MPGKHSFVSIVSSIFFLLGIIFIPFPFDLFPFQVQVTDFLFGKLIGITAEGLFGITLKDTKVYSDSVSMYILILLLCFIAVFLSVLIERIRKRGMMAELLASFVYKIGCYYLALQLLQYGLDKIFKTQFYLPEPNTLYTPLGQVSKDLLFWSSMGTSYSYTIFTGAAEVVAAVLILFKRTRLLGLLAGFAFLLHITAINFSFDISVKAYSCFLLLLSIYLLTPFINRLYHFFFTQGSIPAITTNSNDYLFFKQPFVSVFFKSLFIGLLAVEALYPYVRSGNFNDDLEQRPYLHGAYEVNSVTVGGDTVALVSSPVRRFFIHRNGYMIFQNQQEEMQDYQLTYDTSHHLLILKDYQLEETILRYNYSSRDSLLLLRYEKNGQDYELTGRQLNWKKLPAVKNEFHWTVDAPE
jgi:hypothetical protein